MVWPVLTTRGSCKLAQGKACDCATPTLSVDVDGEAVAYPSCVYREAVTHRWLPAVRDLDALQRLSPLSGWPDEYLAGIVQVWPQYRVALDQRREEERRNG